MDRVEDDWAVLDLGDGRFGYVDAYHLTYQVDTPPQTVTWMAEAGEAIRDCSMRTDGRLQIPVAAGDPVTVTAISNEECLVFNENGCGYVPTSAITLLGFEDDGQTAGKIDPAKARDAAMKVLTQSFKGVANERLTAVTAVYTGLKGQPLPYYHCGYYNANGVYVYGGQLVIDGVQITGNTAQYGIPCLTGDKSKHIGQGEHHHIGRRFIRIIGQIEVNQLI